MSYRVYLRWPPQRVTDKTVTDSATVAAFAYNELLARAELRGQRVALAMTRDGQQVHYHAFDSAEAPTPIP